MQNIRSLTQERSVVEHQVKKGTLPRILVFARPYHRILAIFLGAVVLDAVIGSISPLILRAIIDRGIMHHRVRLIEGLALLTALLAFADAGLSLVQRRISSAMGEGIIYDLRAAVFAHIQKMPVAFFARTQTGALVSRLNNDVVGAQRAFTDFFSNVVGNIIVVVIVLGTMLVLSWQITLVALLLLPLFLVPARKVGRKLGTLFKQSTELNAEMNMVMTERFNVAGATLVKLFGRPDDESMYFESRAAQVRDIGVRQATYSRFFFVALSLTAALATSFAYGFGGVAAVHHYLAVGTVVALTAYLTRLYGPLTQLSNLHLDYMTAIVSFERLFEVLDLEPIITERSDPQQLPDGPVTLSFEHVDFAYPGADEVSLASLEAVATLERHEHTPVLFDVSFSVRPGTLTALVGPSGGGKSTIAQLASRLYDVTGGSVKLNNIDVRDLPMRTVTETVGVVTQDAHLFHDTVRHNLLFAKPDATDDEMWEALRQGQIAPVIAALPSGLDTVVGERGYRLSGGEKQRLALARMLLRAPRIVILDEATAHLDAENEVLVQRALDETMTSRTSLVIAHRLSTIRQADEILVLDKGHIVQRGTHDELLATGGLYADLYETQFAGGDLA